ncbi:glycosyltransferase [Nesterenkonia sp. DZ6]|uniref:glycosyltransferase n=1 Tax=Nesterenkonia sp. DZ6 TaxID=2901229 RepID=UPI001F4CEFDB|nr:glycosyltransferase [Nesterenkonia sp. DZ6]MCH8559407.1 glycosyltransferase [Nesterenkonia sp. DZ6]
MINILPRRGSVAHVSSAHPYTDNRIHYRECQTLTNAGYDVTLIAVDSDVDGPTSGVRVLTIPKRTRFKRAFLSSTQVIYLAIKSRAKIVHLHDPELIPFIPILRISGRSVVYDAHEDLPMQILTKPYLSRAVGRAAVIPAHALIAFARLAAHRVVAATEQVAVRYGPDKTVVVHNYPPLRIEENSPPIKDNIAVYIGAISENRGIIEMLRSTECRDFPSSWELHLAGRGGAKFLEAIEEIGNWSRVVYHGELPSDKARDLLLRSKVGIVVLASTPAHREAFPTKMFEYFAASLPVIASDFPVWRNIIEDSDSGTLVDETDPDAIARAIKAYSESPEIVEAHSKNARLHALEVRNWTTEGLKLVAAYESLT